MIIGIGSDILKVSRMEKLLKNHQDRFLTKFLTPLEREYIKNKDDLARELAKYFAGKEAILKALGTGMIEGLAWKDIEIFRSASGRPSFRLFGGCLLKLERGRSYGFHLSFSDENDTVLAFAAIESL